VELINYRTNRSFIFYLLYMIRMDSSLSLSIAQLLSILSRRSFIPNLIRQLSLSTSERVHLKYLSRLDYEQAIREFFTIAHYESFLDIGANTGYYVHLLAPICMKVHAWEPNPETASKLRAKIKQFDNVEIHEEALGNEKRTLPFYLHSSSEHDGFLLDINKDTFSNQIIQVQVRPLDSYRFDNERIGLMKIDVEGLEAQVVEGQMETDHSGPL